MAKNKRNETEEQSSDEEELFSYLKQVHKNDKVKQVKPGTVRSKVPDSKSNEMAYKNRVNESTTVVSLDNTNEVLEDFVKISDVNKIDQKLQVTAQTRTDSKSNKITNENRVNESTTFLALDYTNEVLEDFVNISDAKSIDLELQVTAQTSRTDRCREPNEIESNIEKLTEENTKNIFEKQIKTQKFTESNKTIESSLYSEDCGRISNVTKEKHKLNATQQLFSVRSEEGVDKVENVPDKMKHSSSNESEKYYLIKEKDWLSLFPKPSGKEQKKSNEQQPIHKTDLLEESNSDTQDLYSSDINETKSHTSKGKGMFNVFKQYNNGNKPLLKNADLTQINASPQKGNATSASRIRTFSNNLQGVSSMNDANSVIKLSSDSETQASPEVEIVYITLEDGQVRYDNKNSPLKATSNAHKTSPDAVKKLDFTEHNQTQAFSNKLQRKNTRNRKSLLQEESLSDSLTDNKAGPFCDTKCNPGMQVRFVRINNKLTRVYERVEHDDIDEVLDASLISDCDKDLELEHGFEHVNTEKEDSFNFDDSHLVAFPLNAVDPEMMIKDDSLVQLTPSKLEMLNTSSSLDPVTPSKLDIFTPSEVDPFTPCKIEMFTPNQLDTFPPSKVSRVLDRLNHKTDIDEIDNSLSLPNQCTSEQSNTVTVDEKMQIEKPITLKVTRSGELVQCYSNENSPVKKGQDLQRSIKTKENRVQDQKKKLWEEKTNRYQRFLFANYDVEDELEKDKSEKASDDVASPNNSSATSQTLSKEKSEKVSCTVSVQACLTDLSDGSNEQGQLNLGKKNTKRKINSREKGMKINCKKVKKTEDIERVEKEPSHAVTVVRNRKVLNRARRSGESNKKNINERYGSCSSALDKGKGKTLKKSKDYIPQVHRDCFYKQVDFEDFDLEKVQKSKTPIREKKKGKADLVVERQNVMGDYTDRKEWKELDGLPSSEKIKEGKIRKRNAEIDKEEKHGNASHSEEETVKGGKKQRSMTKEKVKVMKTDKKAVEYNRNDRTIEHQTGDNSKISVIDESSKKIGFLEKLFQVKLKQAASDTLQIQRSLSETENKCVNERDFQGNDVELLESCSQARGSVHTRKQEKVRQRKNPVARKIERKNTGTFDALLQIDSIGERTVKEKETVCNKGGKYKDVVKERKCKQTQDAKIDLTHKIQEKESVGVRQSSDDTNQNFVKATPSKGKKPRGRQNKKDISLSSQGEDKTGILQTTHTHRNNNEREPTNAKKVRGRPKSTGTTKNRKNLDKKDLNGTASEQQKNVKEIKVGSDKKSKVNKKGEREQNIKFSHNKTESGKSNKRNTNSKKNTSSNLKEQGSFNLNESQSAKMRDSVLVTTDKADEMVDNDKVNTNLNKETVKVSHRASQNLNLNRVDDSNDTITVLPTFHALSEETLGQKPVKLKKPVKLTKNVKKNKIDHLNVSNSKKKKQVDANHTTLNENKKKLTERDKKKLTGKEMNPESSLNLDSDIVEMTLDLSLPKKDVKDVKGDVKSKEIHISQETPSPKKLRGGKVVKRNSVKRGTRTKVLKSAKKTCSSRKLKPVSKRHEKEAWKDMLDDEAFKFDFDERVNEKQKPVNVRHMIRKILKSVKGADKKVDNHTKHKEKKEIKHKHSKDSGVKKKLRLESESDDAWLSDSGPSVSFPGFKFLGMSDSEENKELTKSQMRPVDAQVKDNRAKRILKKFDTKSETELDGSISKKVSNISDPQFTRQDFTTKQNVYIEFHHSPVKIPGLQTNNVSSRDVIDLTSTEPKVIKGSASGSPEIKKNVEKLRDLPDKVSDKKVVKSLKFADIGTTPNKNIESQTSLKPVKL